MEGFGNLSDMGAVAILISALIAVVIALWGMVKAGILAKDETIKALMEENKQLRADKEKLIIDGRDELKRIIDQNTEMLKDVKNRIK